MSDTFQHTDQQRQVLLARARLAAIDNKLRSLNEEREATRNPELRKLLDDQLPRLGEQREALK
jgi:hypothetical protein